MGQYRGPCLGLPQPFRGGGGPRLLEAHIQHLKRLVLFTGEHLAALQREFEPLAGSRELKDQTLARFYKQRDVTRSLHEKAKRLLEDQAQVSTLDALQMLAGFDKEQLVAASKQLEALARELRTNPTTAQLLRAPVPSAGQGTQPLKAQSGTSPLGQEKQTEALGWFAKWMPHPRQTQLPPTKEEASKARETRAVERELQAFDAARALAAESVQNLAPRMTLLGATLEALGAPGKPLPWSLITHQIGQVLRKRKLPQAQANWLPLLAKVMLKDLRAWQAAQVAHTQYQQACALVEEAELLRISLDGAPPDRRSNMLAQFNTGRFKGVILPITNLHLTFRGMPYLEDLFPIPRIPV